MQEVDLERRKETCAQALSLVATAEDLHYQLRADQDALETARAAGHEVCSFFERLHNGQNNVLLSTISISYVLACGAS
jgi:hypothetical protein